MDRLARVQGSGVKGLGHQQQRHRRCRRGLRCRRATTTVAVATPGCQ